VRERDEGDGRTVIGEAEPIPAVGFAELATLFAIHHERVRGEHRVHSAPGVLAVAYDLGSASIIATRWLKTRPDAINAVTLGRHRECDLCLPKDPEISLRHLALIVHPHGGTARQVSFRILDLRTSLAFADCYGQRLEGVIADGPAFFVIGRYALMLLPTGDGTRLPESAKTSWSAIADPVMLDTMGRRQSGIQPVTMVGPGAGAARNDDGMQRTSISVIEGPMRASAGLLDASEEPLGTLEISAGGDTRKLVIGERAASQGLLLGCYERCDDDRLSHLQHSAISRVHLIVFQHEQSLYAIDAASTNGTFVLRDGKRVRTKLARLGRGLEVVLADDRARVVWSPL
jgi:hypothetical protein